MKTNAELLTAAVSVPVIKPSIKSSIRSSNFEPVIIHGDPSSIDAAPRACSSLEKLQITLAFIAGSAMALFTLLL